MESPMNTASGRTKEETFLFNEAFSASYRCSPAQSSVHSRNCSWQDLNSEDFPLRNHIAGPAQIPITMNTATILRITGKIPPAASTETSRVLYAFENWEAHVCPRVNPNA